MPFLSMKAVAHTYSYSIMSPKITLKMYLNFIPNIYRYEHIYYTNTNRYECFKLLERYYPQTEVLCVLGEFVTASKYV